ncbi:MAG: hypothetical protein HY363_02920 [Candidatus Aenigmarchaeota archaeon]|nr:hypothetical protein [Candidatus Aenigmarchaeota archaeon]
MKRFLLTTIVVLMVILVLNASALQINGVKLGDDKQERGKNASREFTITNDANFTITNIAFAHTATSDKNLNFTNIPVNLTAGQSVSLTLTGTIPLNLNAVDSNLKEAAQVIGTMTATAQGNSTTITSNTANIEMQATNKLVIDDLTLFVNGNSESASDGDKIKNLRPGDKLKLEVQVKNKFSDNSDEDIEIEDVEVLAEIDDSDFDLDESEDLGDLGPKDDDSVSFDFDVDDDVDDGTYKLTIKISGKDQNGALHGEENTVRLQVERDTHDITLRRTELSPATLVCGEKNFRLSTSISNFGKRDEDAAAIEILSTPLKLNKKVTDLELDEDRSRTDSFDFTIPADTKPGSYRIDVNTYFDNIARSRSKTLFLTVEACETKQESTVVNTPVKEVKETPKPEQSTVTIVPAPTPRPRTQDLTTFKDSTTYVVLLAGISGLVLLIIVGLLAVFLIRRNK